MGRTLFRTLGASPRTNGTYIRYEIGNKTGWYMKRNEKLLTELREDVATGELVAEVPESILNELDWYEGTELEWLIEGNELILREAD